MIDFDNIVDNIPSEMEKIELNQTLVQYYEEIHEVLQKRLDECQDIIEEFYMSKVNEFKDNLLSNPENDKKTDITEITNEHSEKLSALKSLYDDFLQQAEKEFFLVLDKIKERIP